MWLRLIGRRLEFQELRNGRFLRIVVVRKLLVERLLAFCERHLRVVGDIQDAHLILVFFGIILVIMRG